MTLGQIIMNESYGHCVWKFWCLCNYNHSIIAVKFYFGHIFYSSSIGRLNLASDQLLESAREKCVFYRLCTLVAFESGLTRVNRIYVWYWCGSLEKVKVINVEVIYWSLSCTALDARFAVLKNTRCWERTASMLLKSSEPIAFIDCDWLIASERFCSRLTEITRKHLSFDWDYSHHWCSIKKPS